MQSVRRLIVNADDFGLSASVNAAVIRAHREGVLTTASLMVNEPGFPEAVALARQTPTLGVGLHLTLLCGHSALKREQIPGLVDECGRFTRNPTVAGFRYFFRRELRLQLHDEIRAQFRKFHETGLPLDHVNGHLHLHLHPVIFRILAMEAHALGMRAVRWTRDPFWLNAKLAKGRFAYRISHALIFSTLSRRVQPTLARLGLRHTCHVFGLLQNALVDEAYVLGLLEQLPAGDSELYSHPSLHEFKHEFEALVSPRIRQAIERQHIRLIRYSDL